MTINNRFTEANVTAKQSEAIKLLKGALKGDIKDQHKFIEGISTSDIPVQITPVLNRIALDEYEAAPTTWQQWAQRMTLPSFESSPYYSFAWGDDDVERDTAGTKFYEGGLARVPEYGEYPVLRFTASEQNLKLAKSGIQIKFSWETLIATRDFGLIQRAYAEFGRRASFTEEIEATKNLVDSSGLNDTVWNAGNQNIATGNPALSLDALVAAFQQIATQTYNGRRIQAPSRYNLIVPRSLELVAEQIKAIQEVRTVSGVGTEQETRTVTGNPVAAKFDVVVSDAVSTIAGASADSAWFLVPKIGQAANPNFLELFLQGHEAPEYFVQKTTTGDPVDGAYIDDSYSQKVRHAVSGGFLTPSGTLASTGAGS